MILDPASSDHHHNGSIHDTPQKFVSSYAFPRMSGRVSVNILRNEDVLVQVEPRIVKQHPTQFLPHLTKHFDSDSVIIALDRLFALYVDAWRPWDASNEGKDDIFERDFAIRWLSAVACRLSKSNEDRHEPLLNKVTSLLAVCSGSSGSGEIVRTLSFPSTQNEAVEVCIQEGSINSHDHPGAVGMQIWGSASVLGSAIAVDPAYFLPDTADGRPLRVLELGAGTGVVSLVVAKLFSGNVSRAVDIVATDFDAVVLSNLGKNIMHNASFSGQVTICARHLDWQDFVISPFNFRDHEGQRIPKLDATLRERFDVIFGADVVYEQHQASWLKATVEGLLRRPSMSSPLSIPQPRFHLVVPLRPTHLKEYASITASFPFAPKMLQKPNVSHSSQETDYPGEAHLAILKMEEVGLEENEPYSTVRYTRYEIGWVPSMLDPQKY